MIPRANITAWRNCAPWPADSQVEQDLVLSRAIVALFGSPRIATRLAFRGGTALHKLFLHPPSRYSEDIDLVQLAAGPIGPIIDEIRAALDPWLEHTRYKAGEGRFTLRYRFETTSAPVIPMQVKIEINTREHFRVHGIVRRRFEVANPWFTGSSSVTTYSLSELLGTKLRALFQRKKGRDLFDLMQGLDHPDTAPEQIVEAFSHYMTMGKTPVTRAQFEANMHAKMQDSSFLADVRSLLRTGLDFDPVEGWRHVHDALVKRLPGEPWKGVDGSNPDRNAGG